MRQSSRLNRRPHVTLPLRNLKILYKLKCKALDSQILKKIFRTISLIENPFHGRIQGSSHISVEAL